MPGWSTLKQCLGRMLVAAVLVAGGARGEKPRIKKSRHLHQTVPASDACEWSIDLYLFDPCKLIYKFARIKASQARSGRSHLIHSTTHAGAPSMLATTYRTCGAPAHVACACRYPAYVQACALHVCMCSISAEWTLKCALAWSIASIGTHLWVATRDRVHDRVRRHLRRSRLVCNSGVIAVLYAIVHMYSSRASIPEL